MVFLKAAGVVLACILALIALLLIALLHFRFVFTLEGEPKAELRIFFIKINLLARREKKPKKPKKKPRRFAAYLKRKFGFEHPPEAPAPEGETVSAKAKWVYALIMIVAGRVKWLLKRVKLEKLRILAVCGGGDAADSAMEYGTVCAVLYTLAGFVIGNDILAFCGLFHPVRVSVKQNTGAMTEALFLFRSQNLIFRVLVIGVSHHFAEERLFS